MSVSRASATTLRPATRGMTRPGRPGTLNARQAPATVVMAEEAADVVAGCAVTLVSRQQNERGCRRSPKASPATGATAQTTSHGVLTG